MGRAGHPPELLDLRPARPTDLDHACAGLGGRRRRPRHVGQPRHQVHVQRLRRARRAEQPGRRDGQHVGQHDLHPRQGGPGHGGNRSDELPDHARLRRRGQRHQGRPVRQPGQQPDAHHLRRAGRQHAQPRDGLRLRPGQPRDQRHARRRGLQHGLRRHRHQRQSHHQLHVRRPGQRDLGHRRPGPRHVQLLRRQRPADGHRWPGRHGRGRRPVHRLHPAHHLRARRERQRHAADRAWRGRCHGQPGRLHGGRRQRGQRVGRHRRRPRDHDGLRPAGPRHHGDRPGRPEPLHVLRHRRSRGQDLGLRRRGERGADLRRHAGLLRRTGPAHPRADLWRRRHLRRHHQLRRLR